MSNAINTVCVYHILSYLTDKEIVGVDSTCKQIAMNRSASKLQRAYHKWVSEKDYIRDNDVKIYLKRYTPLTLRDHFIEQIKELTIMELMNLMMSRFDEMTYDETSAYINVRHMCDQKVCDYHTYADLQTGLLPKIPDMLLDYNPTIDRSIVKYCLIDDTRCEWLLQHRYNIKFSELIDIVQNVETLQYYTSLFFSRQMITLKLILVNIINERNQIQTRG